jgi:hypothetical protein
VQRETGVSKIKELVDIILQAVNIQVYKYMTMMVIECSLVQYPSQTLDLY